MKIVVDEGYEVDKRIKKKEKEEIKNGEKK
jgi:hypothetical protein